MAVHPEVRGHCIANFGRSKIPSCLKDEKYVLSLEPQIGLIDLLEEAKSISLHSPAVVISLLGSTTSGKSTLARLLLNLSVDGPGGPRVLEDVTAGPTTAGCWHYSSLQRANWHVLDMEGMDGCDSPPNDASLIQYGTPTQRHILDSLTSPLPHTAQSIEGLSTKNVGKLRAAAAKEHLPRLAYITSDVVIFIWNENVWGNRRVSSAVRKAAELAAPQGVRLVNMPHCIILWNKASQKRKVDQDDTQLFFERQREDHEVTGLASLYQSVHVVRLHDWDKDPEEFKANWANLRALIEQLSEQRLQARSHNGALYNSLYWVRLLALSLRKFHLERDLRFDVLLREAIATDQTEEVKAAFKFFSEFNESNDYYAPLCLAALRYYICLSRNNLYSHREHDPNAASSSQVLDAFGTKELEGLELLVTHLDQLAPCKPPCILSRAEHGSFHQSLELTGVKGLLRRVGRRVGLSKNDWHGTFSGEGFPRREATLEFQRVKTRLESIKTTNATYLGRAEQVRECCRMTQASLSSQYCMLCMSPPDMTARCLHRFCTPCFNEMTTPTNSHSTDFYRPILKLTEGDIDARMCPICSLSLFVSSSSHIPSTSSLDGEDHPGDHVFLGSVRPLRATEP